jgi:hypothetical protein
MGFLNRSSDDLEEMLSTETDPDKLLKIQQELVNRGIAEDQKLMDRWGISPEDSEG